jgi:superfamily II DNA or RNA helicase
MMPKHKKTSYFCSKRLFDNLSSFSELENRIANLPEIERGDAFEVFAEAYLKTQPLHQVEEIWPERVLPQSLRDMLNIPSDAGIDGVFKTFSGDFKAYQVKFRSNRDVLSWGSDGLGNFFGQADRVNERVLFTNSVDLSHLASSRVDFYSIRGSDLDSLTLQEFQVIDGWLKTGVKTREKLIPRAHQMQAIDAIIEELRVNNRTTAIMACGTGKTLVALNVAAKSGAKTILVLLPSLALIRQTLHDWARNYGWENFNFLCVCSDDTVVKGEDDTILYQRDLDFAVTTQSENVANFLANQNLATKIIFSTYQSCHTVAQALPQGFIFDLAVFDEAHKTASRSATNYAFALIDSNISVRKRLFLTATPRHYNIDRRDKSGEQKIVFSMDDETIYGRVAYKLSFRAAVEQNLICDYKVIISVITSDMLNRELLKHGEVLVKGDIIKAQRIANILAVQKAVEQYGAKRIFSFHSSVSAAKSFTANSTEGIGIHLKDFATMHVNGEMSASKRDAILNEFRDSKKALISNARCLTEGVNVPAVDMVAFISPKRSKVDIAQAAGRAMRKYNNKTRGYILIPLFVQIKENEVLEEALNKTRFDTVWDVLQAMQEQDENLVEIIAKLKESRGRGIGINDNRLRDFVEILGPELLLSDLREAIVTNIIDNLGLSWDERFGELLKYKEIYGHCNVPQNFSENKALATWVGVQRNLNNSNSKRLTQYRKDKLDAIGFEWNPIATQWNKMFFKLKEFKEKNGHCNIPQRDSLFPQLGTWAVEQRKDYKKKKLSSYQIERLKSIDFVFDILNERWNRLYSELCLFKEKNKHCDVTRDYVENIALATWIAEQRKARRKNKLTPERIDKLNALSFKWNPFNEYQEKMLEELREFKEKNGHCNVPQQYKASTLGKWTIAQRIKYKKNKLLPELISKLEELGFDWNPLDTVWDSMYQELCDFQKKYGHCIIKHGYENKRLVTWVQQQRILYANENLSKDRYEELNKIGFIWNTFEELWEKRFNELLDFHNKNANCDVPVDYENYSLFRWIGTQRTLYKKNQLTQDRIHRLNQLGFRWCNKTDESWDKKLIELADFKHKHGHTNVPLRYRHNPSLGKWANMQRNLYKRKKLDEARMQKLLELGFIFDPFAYNWEQQFSALYVFKSTFGHCNVPGSYKDDLSLGVWVNRQRIEYRRQRLSSYKISRLESIGFSWGASK